MAMSFTDLYKASVPIILICAFVSLLFWEGKALSKKKGKDSRRSVKENRLLLACFPYVSMKNLDLIFKFMTIMPFIIKTNKINSDTRF